jgi:hypothetical protein
MGCAHLTLKKKPPAAVAAGAPPFGHPSQGVSWAGQLTPPSDHRKSRFPPVPNLLFGLERVC